MQGDRLEGLEGSNFFRIERVSPKEFADAARKLRDEYDMNPLVDHDSPIQVANLYPRMTVEEVAEDMGVEYHRREYLTPTRMRNIIQRFKQR